MTDAATSAAAPVRHRDVPRSGPEIALARRYLEREFGLLQPSVVLQVGKMAIDAFLDKRPLTETVGRVFERDGVQPLAQELAQWGLQAGRPAPDELLFPRRRGHEWQEHDWRNWRRRIYQPVARQVGITGDMRPRRLRASFVER